MNERKLVRSGGEPYIWLTAMGLTVGLGMIAGLLAVIFVNGFEVFWPKRVALLSLSSDSRAKLGAENAIGGEVVKTRKKRTQPGEAFVSEDQPGSEHVEWQLFVGNKDVYGLSYKYIDKDDIAEVGFPEDLILVERLEYGDAIGYPLALATGPGEIVSATEPSFEARLEESLRRTLTRWEEIERIEKKQIGSISSRIENLRVRERTILEKRGGEQGPLAAELASIRESLRGLEADYEVLAAQARELRELQAADVLTYRLPSGGESKTTLGAVVHYYYPNRLSFLERVRLLARNCWTFVSEEPREANTEGGIFPAIFGTFVMTLLMSIAVMPFGMLAAIYLREYAKQGPFVRTVRIAVNNLAGVPSIVFGVFGLGFFVYLTGGTIDTLFYSDKLPTPTFGTGGILWASLTLALMTVPVVIVATEEGLASVPRGMRDGSLALGASKWQTIQRIALPGASPGILTGMILAMARGAGEVAPLMLVGVVKLAPTLPLDLEFPFIHPERKFMHLGFHIYDLGFQSPDSEAARPMVFATTFLLILLVVLLNVAAIIIRERLRRRYATAAF